MTETTLDRARGRLRRRVLDVISWPTDQALGRLSPPTVENIRQGASRGLDDPDPDPDADEPLRLLVRDLADDETLTSSGRLIERLRLHLTVRGRLRVRAHLRENPDVAATAVDRPIFVVGLPRTGTTLLQGLLAAHPDVRPVQGWESFDPLPSAPVATRRRDWSNHLRFLRTVAPDTQTVHPMSVDGPDEGMEMIDRTLHSNYFAFFGGSHYQSWLEARSHAEMVDAYRIYADQLRLLVRQQPGRILVKSPALVGRRRVLAELLPGARFVVPHRDLTEAIPSALSLSAVVRTMSRRLDPVDTGPEILGYLETVVRQMAEEHERSSGDTVPVRYVDLVGSPSAEIARVYEALDLPVPSDLERLVERVLTELPSPQGRHVYDLAQFGLSDGDLEPLIETYGPVLDA